jgi:hypothetical protein
LALLVCAYFLPLIIAGVRKVPNIGSVAVINLFLGWTFIGWVVALAMAFRSADRNVIVNQYGAANLVAAAPVPQPAGWFPDPARRHELRYWNGTGWTEHVSDRGVGSTDAMP